MQIQHPGMRAYTELWDVYTKTRKAFSMWILSGADRELVQCTNFIPNKESEKLLQIRTWNLIGWGKNPTIPRARTPDDRLLLENTLKNSIPARSLTDFSNNKKSKNLYEKSLEGNVGSLGEGVRILRILSSDCVLFCFSAP